MFKVNNKDTSATPVNFEQVNAGCDHYKFQCFFSYHVEIRLLDYHLKTFPNRLQFF